MIVARRFVFGYAYGASPFMRRAKHLFGAPACFVFARGSMLCALSARRRANERGETRI